MITVIIPVRDEEERLLRSLAALAPLAADGLVADVVVADCGSRDQSLVVADAAGCAIIENCPDRAAAIAGAIAVARKGWLLLLAAGDLADAAVAGAARDHVLACETAGAARPAAYLALPAAAGALRRAWLGRRFDALGAVPPALRRLLAPRQQAELTLAEPALAAPGRWRGARLRARIGRTADRPSPK